MIVCRVCSKLGSARSMSGPYRRKRSVATAMAIPPFPRSGGRAPGSSCSGGPAIDTGGGARALAGRFVEQLLEGGCGQQRRVSRVLQCRPELGAIEHRLERLV